MSSHKVVHTLYNHMFRPWVLAIFRLFTAYRSAIQYAKGLPQGGGDKISSYNIGRHGPVMFLTSVAISIAQVGVLLRLCFDPTITYVDLGNITGATDRLL